VREGLSRKPGEGKPKGTVLLTKRFSMHMGQSGGGGGEREKTRKGTSPALREFIEKLVVY